MIRTLWPATITCCLAFLYYSSGAPPLPELTLNAFRQAPTLDGELRDSCWQGCPAITNFYLYKGDGKTVQDTKVMAGRDDQWLYLGFECHNPHLGITEQKVFEHDDSVQYDDAVELFIDPGTAGALYFHFLLSYAGVKAEQRVLKEGKKYDRDWQTAWCAATKRTATGWNTEVAIPLFLLAANGDVARAKINICRNKIISLINIYGVKIGERAELSSSFPVIRSFHEPYNFGGIKGLADLKIVPPFTAGYENLRINPYRQDGDVFSYSVSLDISGQQLLPGTVKVTITDKPKNGPAKDCAAIVAFTGQDKKSVTIDVPVAALAERRVGVALEDDKTKMVFQREECGAAILRPMIVYLDRSYYSSETNALVVCEIGIPPQALTNASLVVTDKKEEVLGQTADLAANTRVPFAIGGLSNGEHKVVLSLRDKAGNALFRETLALRKLPPHPGGEWKIDQVNRIVLHDNKPYFPVGIMNDYLWDEKGLRLLQTMNFNSLLEWAGDPNPELAKQHAAAASKYGLTYMGNVDSLFTAKPLDRNPDELLNPDQYAAVKAIYDKAWRLASFYRLGDVRIPPFTKGKLFLRYYEQNRDRISTAMQEARNMANCLGWFMLDEPRDDASLPMMEVAHRLRQQLHEIDGYKLVLCNYASYIPKGDQYVDWVDILATDPYWVPGSPNSQVNYVADRVAETDRRAQQFRKVTMTVPMCSEWSGSTKRAILPEELFCQGYLAIIHGARGIYYFVANAIRAVSTVEALTRLNRQIQDLSPALLADEIRQTISYRPVPFNPAKNEFPAVQVALKRNPGGGYVLLAANSCSYPVEAAYTLAGLGKKGTVKRFFSDREYPVVNGSFTEKIESLGTRAYIIPVMKLEEPAAIGVTTVASHEDEGKKEATLPVSWRQGKKNVLPNPSFEEATIPGWPDYYMGWYADPFIGSTNAGWGQDTHDPVDGAGCMKIAFKRGGRPNGIMICCLPQHDRATEYVFSAYLKASQDDKEVLLTGEGGDGIIEAKTIKPTTSWKRYHTKVTIPARGFAPSGYWFMIYTTSPGEWTLWIDALQLEQGAKPTAFEQ